MRIDQTVTSGGAGFHFGGRGKDREMNVALGAASCSEPAGFLESRRRNRPRLSARCDQIDSDDVGPPHGNHHAVLAGESQFSSLYPEARC